MLKDIYSFYEKTKLTKVTQDPEVVPVTFIKVFHKQYPRMPRIVLPKSKGLGQLEKVLSIRESVREYSKKPLTFRQVAGVLNVCRIVDSTRKPERRTYPSAGARFPIEIYLISFNTGEPIERGVYHYDILAGALELLWSSDLRGRTEEITSPYLKNPAAAIVLTSVIARSEIKYGHKAYPYSLIEAGHIAQNLQLACAKLRIGSCPVGGFVNESISEILDLTRDEIPLYVLGIGRFI